jgi:hypothetical protein
VRCGIDQTIALEITEHRTSAVFSRYNIFSENDLRLAMKQHAANAQSTADQSGTGCGGIDMRCGIR